MRLSWMVLVVPALLGCPPSRGDDDDSGSARLLLQADKQEVRADLQDGAQVTLVVVGASHAPETVHVEVTAPGWLTAAAGDTGVAEGLVVDAPVQGGRSSVVLSCLDADGKPQAGMVVLVASYLDADRTVASDALAFTCTAVTDLGQVSFTAPGFGDTVRGWPRQEVALSVVEFDGAPASRARAVVVTSSTTAIQVAARADQEPAEAGQPVTLDVAGGVAHCFLVYPGDAALAAGPLPVSLSASFTSLLGAESTAQRTFYYGVAANLSTVRFAEVQPVVSNDSRVHVTALSPPAVTLSAGPVASGNAASFTVEVRDRDGQPPPSGTRVDVSCELTGTTSNAQDCQGLTVFPPDSTEGSPAQYQAEGWLPSVTEAGTQEQPHRGVVRVVFKPSPQSTPGTLRLRARFTPAGGEPMETAPEECARITLGAAP